MLNFITALFHTPQLLTSGSISSFFGKEGELSLQATRRLLRRKARRQAINREKARLAALYSPSDHQHRFSA